MIVFAILSLGFPGTLCGWCEQLGNYGFAVRYASLYYSYTCDVADLARCAEDSILSENDGDITEYCAKLVDDEEFESYCALRDEEINGSIAGDDDFQDITFSYRQYSMAGLRAHITAAAIPSLRSAALSRRSTAVLTGKILLRSAYATIRYQNFRRVTRSVRSHFR